MKIAVLNSKGGVGKSTISVQIAATYVYATYGEAVHHYEFDDENEDSKAFINTKLIIRHSQKVAQANLRADITDILLEHEHLIFDVGANKTTTYFIEALKETGMMSHVDLFIIPLMDGENDAISAIKIFNHLKQEEPTAKIIFALNRVNTNRDLGSQFNVFLGDKRGVFNDKGLIEDIDEKDRVYITLNDSDAIKYGKNFGLTVWELAHTKRNLAAEIKEATQNNEPKEVIRMLSFKKGVKDDCEKYITSVVKPSFELIKKIVGEADAK